MKKKIRKTGKKEDGNLMYYVRIPKTLVDTGILNVDQLYEIEIKAGVKAWAKNKKAFGVPFVGAKWPNTMVGGFALPDIRRSIKMDDEDKEFVKANKSLFLERYFSYFSDKNRASLLNRIKSRQKIRRL